MANLINLSQEILRFFKYVCARLHQIWSKSRTCLFRLFTIIKQILLAIWSLIHWLLQQSDLVSAFDDNRKTQSELPKKLVEHKRWRALRKCNQHLLPIGITIFLVILNFSTLFWEAPGDPNQNTSLNALQFAAKVHEILIVSSLSMLVLDAIQLELLRGAGISIGSLFSSFQVADIASLWAPGFWAMALAKNKSTRNTLLVLLVLISIILGAICGPSSVILMLPALDWWHNPLSPSAAKKHFGAITGLFIDSPSSTLWPTEITTSNFLPQDCNFTDSQIPTHCPAGGLPTMLAWGVSPIGPTIWNLTMPVGQLNRFLQGAAGNDGTYDWYMSQTTSAMVGNALSVFSPGAISTAVISTSEPTRWTIFSLNESHLHAPQVFVGCSITIYESLDPSFETNSSFDNTLHFPLKSTTKSPNMNKTWSATAKPLLDLWSPENTFGALWIEPPDLDDETPSIGIAIIANRSYVHFGNGVTPEVYIGACSILAGWRPAEVYVDTTDTYIHSSTINDPNQVLTDWIRNRKNASSIQQVKLDIDWANASLPPNETLSKVYTELTVSNGASPILAFGPTVSALVADALARIGMDSNITLGKLVINKFGQILDIDGSHVDATTNSARFEFEVTRLRYGYSYSMRGTTRRLAAGVLLVHVLIAWIHTTIIVCRGYIHSGFTSLHEILALAINSTPTQILENTCAGIARLDTYKHVVKIREVSNTHLGLILNNEGHSYLPKEEKLYGTIGIGDNLNIYKNTKSESGSSNGEECDILLLKILLTIEDILTIAAILTILMKYS